MTVQKESAPGQTIDAETGCADDAMPGSAEDWNAALLYLGQTDLDGMLHAAAEDDSHGHHLQARYLRQGASEIARLRARVKELECGLSSVAENLQRAQAGSAKLVQILEGNKKSV